MTSIYPDFLPKQQFKAIEELMMKAHLPWHFNDEVVTTKGQFMFTHAFVLDGQVVSPRFYEPIRAMLNLIQQKRQFIGVTRVKANLYTNQGRIIEHPSHYDIPPDSGYSDKYCIGVFHINTCNGMTVIGNQKVPSVANQLILFENVEHFGTTQTDTDTRVMINFNLRTKP